jgi:hypothetical protein
LFHMMRYSFAKKTGFSRYLNGIGRTQGDAPTHFSPDR